MLFASIFLLLVLKAVITAVQCDQKDSNSVFKLRDHLEICNDDERTKLDNLIAQMEAEEAPDAWGYYSVQKTTLTSLFSTIVTYLIILVQFKNG